jgi:hypothetical protein
MKKFPLMALSLCLVWASTQAAEDKIRQAIDQRLVTSEFLKTLTYDDVPNHWKAQKKIEPSDKYVRIIYSRGEVRLLEILWSNDWTDDKAKMFVATVYRGDKRLSKITHISDATTIWPTNAPKGYQVVTSIKDDGTATVTVTKNDNTFVEGVVLDGRETHLLDDLEYTKTALGLQSVTKPQVKALRNGAGQKAKKSKKKSGRKRS